MCGVEPVLCTVSGGTTVGTIEHEALRPGSPSIPPISFNINGLQLPVPFILKEFGEDGRGLSDKVDPGLNPWKGEGAGFNGAFVRASLHEPKGTKHSM